MNKSTVKQSSIWFINTFQPVAPLYKTVFPLLRHKEYHPVALISQGGYRATSQNNDSDWLMNYSELLWIPSFLRDNKRWCAIFYYIIAPFKLIFSWASLHVFLTQPPLFFILGSVISRLKNIPYVVHIMDRFPEVLARLNLIPEQGIMYRVLFLLVINVLKNAASIIVIGRCMKDDLIRQGIEPDKIIVVTNWADSNVHPIKAEENSFIKLNNLENKFIIMYSGNMGLAHEFTTILKAAESLSDYPDIIFIFVGKGVRRNEIEQGIAHGLHNIRLFDYQPQSLLPSSLSAASVHFISLRNGFEGLMVPSKFYGTLASGKPIIYEGNDYGEIARAIEEIGCGAVIEPGDVYGIVSKILFYYANQEARLIDGYRALAANHAKYKADRVAENYTTTLLQNVN